jgi:hypothetical protein
MEKLSNVAPQLPATVAQSSTPSTDSMQPSPEQAERLRKITRMAKRLFTAYPKSDYGDPDSAAAGMVNVLKGYPLSVVDRLTNESKPEALQLKHKFPPRLAEIKEAADALMSEKTQREARASRIAEQIAARAEAEQPKGDRPSYAELKAKYGPTFGIDPDGGERKVVENTFRTMNGDELRAYYANHSEQSKGLTGSAGTRKGTKA